MPHSQDESHQKAIPLLVIGTLGTVSIVAFKFLMPATTALDILLAFVIVPFAAVGYSKGLMRGLLTVGVLYITTGLAATLYPSISPYTGAIRQLLHGNVNVVIGQGIDRAAMSLAFLVLWLLFWIILGLLVKVTFPETSLPALGILDNLGGLLVYTLIGVLVASLLFAALGYGWAPAAHDRAYLRPAFNQVIRIHYFIQSFWFLHRPPAIYVYDLNLSGG